MVLLCLAVVMISITAIARTTLKNQQQLIDYQTRLQADWLAEAGISRAISRLQIDQEYVGEIWTANLSDAYQGSVEIKVVRNTEDSKFEIDSLARYPLNSETPKVDRKKITYSPQKPGVDDHANDGA